MARSINRMQAALFAFLGVGVFAAAPIFAEDPGQRGKLPAKAHPVPSADRCATFMAARLSIRDEAARGRSEQAKMLAGKIQPTITAATWKPTSPTVPEYCRIEGHVTTGDAKSGFGQVRFAVNLPSSWNGRFVMIGDGGYDGAV